jgi:predicted alpha/beta superfamily hydrolase
MEKSEQIKLCITCLTTICGQLLDHNTHIHHHTNIHSHLYWIFNKLREIQQHYIWQ